MRCVWCAVCGVCVGWRYLLPPLAAAASERVVADTVLLSRARMPLRCCSSTYARFCSTAQTPRRRWTAILATCCVQEMLAGSNLWRGCWCSCTPCRYGYTSWRVQRIASPANLHRALKKRNSGRRKERKGSCCSCCERGSINTCRAPLRVRAVRRTQQGSNPDRTSLQPDLHLHLCIVVTEEYIIFQLVLFLINKKDMFPYCSLSANGSTVLKSAHTPRRR